MTLPKQGGFLEASLSDASALRCFGNPESSIDLLPPSWKGGLKATDL